MQYASQPSLSNIWKCQPQSVISDYFLYKEIGKPSLMIIIYINQVTHIPVKFLILLPGMQVQANVLEILAYTPRYSWINLLKKSGNH